VSTSLRSLLTFSPAPSSSQTASSPAPSSSQTASSLAAPPLPQRKDSSAQADDIEDVKKVRLGCKDGADWQLCAMGFSRTLVIAALDANGYDFQKALNVLLAQ